MVHRFCFSKHRCIQSWPFECFLVWIQAALSHGCKKVEEIGECGKLSCSFDFDCSYKHAAFQFHELCSVRLSIIQSDVEASTCICWSFLNSRKVWKRFKALEKSKNIIFTVLHSDESRLSEEWWWWHLHLQHLSCEQTTPGLHPPFQLSLLSCCFIWFLVTDESCRGDEDSTVSTSMTDIEDREWQASCAVRICVVEDRKKECWAMSWAKSIQICV